MMAVAALSLAVQDGNARLDALQHYQQALPALQTSLKSPNDLSSDGAFLTHFLLLIYEVGEEFRSRKVTCLSGVRLPRPKQHIRICGLNISRHFCEFLY